MGTRQPSPIILPRMSSQPTASIYGTGLTVSPLPRSSYDSISLAMPGCPWCPSSLLTPSSSPAPKALWALPPQHPSVLFPSLILSAAAWPRPPPSPVSLPHASLPPSQVSPHSQGQLSNSSALGSHCLKVKINLPRWPRGPSQSGASAELTERQGSRLGSGTTLPVLWLFTGCETGPQFAHLLNGTLG